MEEWRGNGAPSEPVTPAERVVLPKAQLEDLKLVRNEWGKIVRQIWAARSGPAIRGYGGGTGGRQLSLRCIYGSEQFMTIGKPSDDLGDMERYVEEHYRKINLF